MADDSLLAVQRATAGAVIAEDDGGEVVAHFGDPQREYRALVNGAGVCDLRRRTQIELCGADRVQFLHNMCTNDIRRLVPGGGCEAFITNVQGRILAYVTVYAAPESLVLETVPGQAERLINHLDRYIIREDVQLVDRSADWAELLVAGTEAAARCKDLAAVEWPGELCRHVAAEIAGQPVSIRCVDLVGPGGWLVSGPRHSMAAVWQALVNAGMMPCGREAFETARIEAGTPYYGRDITDKNLPQEVARESRTISFTKGCYLGQETVARLDALGHVNRTLCGIVFDGAEVPTAGDELTAADKVVGQVTSSTFSPRLSAPLALGYVRVGHNQPGAEMQWQGRGARVVELPLS